MESIPTGHPQDASLRAAMFGKRAAPEPADQLREQPFSRWSRTWRTPVGDDDATSTPEEMVEDEPRDMDMGAMNKEEARSTMVSKGTQVRWTCNDATTGVKEGADKSIAFVGESTGGWCPGAEDGSRGGGQQNTRRQQKAIPQKPKLTPDGSQWKEVGIGVYSRTFTDARRRPGSHGGPCMSDVMWRTVRDARTSKVIDDCCPNDTR